MTIVWARTLDTQFRPKPGRGGLRRAVGHPQKVGHPSGTTCFFFFLLLYISSDRPGDLGNAVPKPSRRVNMFADVSKLSTHQTQASKHTADSNMQGENLDRHSKIELRWPKMPSLRLPNVIVALRAGLGRLRRQRRGTRTFPRSRCQRVLGLSLYVGQAGRP